MELSQRFGRRARELFEVSTKLIFNHPNCANTWQLPNVYEKLYQEYVQLVNILCDTISRSSGPSWRDPFYAACINDIQAMLSCISSDIETTDRHDKDFRSSPYPGNPSTYHSHTPQPDSRTPVSAVTSQSSTSSESSQTLTGKSSSPTALDSPASSVGSENQKANQTLAESSKLSTPVDACTLSTSKHRHSTISLTRDDTTSACDQSSPQTTKASRKTAIAASPDSPTYAAFPPLDDGKAHCDMCSKSFSGTRQHRESNLKRHMNDIHQLGLRLCCTEPGCGKMCGRTDNLRSHRLKVHGIDDPPARPSNSTRHRKSTKRRKRTPPCLTQIETHKPSLW